MKVHSVDLQKCPSNTQKYPYQKHPAPLLQATVYDISILDEIVRAGGDSVGGYADLQ